MIPIPFEILKVGHCLQNEALACRSAAWRTGEFPALVGLLHHPLHGPILLDTGYAPRFDAATRGWPERLYRLTTPVGLPASEELLTQFTARGIAAAAIRTVVVSHFHADHICGLRDFPSARFVGSRVAWQDIAGAGRLSGVRRGLLPALLPEDFAARADFIEDRDSVSLPPELVPFEVGRDILGDGSVLAVDLPGHAAGQIGIVFAAADGRRAFLVADAAYSMRAIRENALPMAIAGLLLGHSADYPVTLSRLHALHRSCPDILIVPSHCPERARELVR